MFSNESLTSHENTHFKLMFLFVYKQFRSNRLAALISSSKDQEKEPLIYFEMSAVLLFSVFFSFLKCTKMSKVIWYMYWQFGFAHCARAVLYIVCLISNIAGNVCIDGPVSISLYIRARCVYPTVRNATDTLIVPIGRELLRFCTVGWEIL